MRKCKCGCGEPVTDGRRFYLPGHKPKEQAEPAPEEDAAEEASTEERDAAEEASSEEQSWTLSVTLTDSQIETAWQRLSSQDKAALIQHVLETL